MGEYKRTCPDCGDTITHKVKYQRDIAREEERLCVACAAHNRNRLSDSDKKILGEIRDVVRGKMAAYREERQREKEEHQQELARQLMKQIKEKKKMDERLLETKQQFTDDHRFAHRAVVVENTVTGQKFVRVVKDLELLKERFQSHCRQDMYPNEHIQLDFDKFGFDSFRFMVVGKSIDDDTVYDIADAMIRYLQFTNQLYDDEIQTRVEYFVRSPNGVNHEIIDVKEFALVAGLSYSLLYQLLNGTIDELEGWTVISEEEFGKEVDLNNVLPKSEPDKKLARSHRGALTGQQAREIVRRIKNGEVQNDLAQEFDVTPSVISNIKHGKVYSWATGETE